MFTFALPLFLYGAIALLCSILDILNLNRIKKILFSVLALMLFISCQTNTSDDVFKPYQTTDLRLPAACTGAAALLILLMAVHRRRKKRAAKAARAAKA